MLKKEIAQQYIQASVHYGHAPREWNPKMAPYILYTKYGYHIFDLVKTAKLLKLAGNVLERKAERGGRFLFVGTNKLSSFFIEQEAKRCHNFYVNYRWLGGMLTNWTTIQKQMERFHILEQQEKTGEFQKISKKEAGTRKKELEKFQRLFSGMKTMSSFPDAVIFTNQRKDMIAIQECLKLGIPTISIVDSDGNPDLIPYPIPANDDSSSSIQFILHYLANRILKGYTKREKKEEKEKF